MESLVTLAITGTECMANKQTDILLYICRAEVTLFAEPPLNPLDHPLPTYGTCHGKFGRR